MSVHIHGAAMNMCVKSRIFSLNIDYTTEQC